MPKETPLQTMKRLYDSKDKLVETVAKALKTSDEDLSAVKERLKTASNRKLLRLAEITSAVGDKYGGVDKLVDQLASGLGRAKDSDYVAKLRTKSQGSLLDMMRVVERRARQKPSA